MRRWRSASRRAILTRLKARENGVRQAHACERACRRQQSGPQRAADKSADDRNHRQEEADRYAGEAGQDEQGCFRDHIDRAAGRGCCAQARVPEKRESDDCRGEANERSPYFTVSLAPHCECRAAAPKRRLAGLQFLAAAQRNGRVAMRL
jgi:hypothetical protein